MTTKVLTGTYAAGYYLTSPTTILSLTASGYVEGKGVYTRGAPANAYTLINDGKIAGGATGVYLGNGGLVTNGSPSDTAARITGVHAVYILEAGTVHNFASIISPGGTGIGVHFTGVVVNGSTSDTAARIQGHTAVLAQSVNGVVCTIHNYGVIAGYGSGNTAVAVFNNGSLVNGSALDTGAAVYGEYAVKANSGPATVTNFGYISGRGPEANASGVYLTAGGKVTNGAANDVVAQIVGNTGVLATGAAATVVNFGKIASLKSFNPGVGLSDGGVVINGALTDTDALIVGGRGVDILGAAGTVSNFGTIVGSSRAGYYFSGQYAGVNLLAGGKLTNGASGDTTALITGYDGVDLVGGVCVNFGSIQANGGYGASVTGAATMTNEASGTIGGWLGVELDGAATLTNFGAVAGQGGTAVFAASATTRVNAEAGSKFVGLIGGRGTFDFVSGVSTASGLRSGGMVTGAGTLSLNGGVSVLESGIKLLVAEIDVAGAATKVNFYGDIGFAKVWKQAGGTVNVAPTAGKASFTGVGDAFSGTLAGAGTIAFAGGSDTLSALTLSAAGVTIGAAATVTLSSVITNKTLVSITSSKVIVAPAGATLTGGGKVVLSNSATNKIAGASATAKLTLADGVIAGAGNLGGGSMVLVNGAGGLITDNVSGALTIDTGAARITNAGVIENTGTGTLTIKSALANTGALAVAHGVLTVDGAVTGAGKLTISGGKAFMASTFTENVTFGGASGVLELAHGKTYTGQISGFSKTGTTQIDLDDIAFGVSTKATYSGTTTAGVLTVSNGTSIARIHLTGDYTASTFIVASDGHGGTLVHDPAKVGASAPALVVAMSGFGATGAATSAPWPERWSAPIRLVLSPGTRAA